jgi:hypothetical protein
MATIKSYTSLEQSKKLAEILPLESADMYIYKNIFFGALSCFNDTTQVGEYIKLTDKENKAYPCWSLAALFSVLPEIQGSKPIIDLNDNYITYPHISDLHTKADNPVDACVEMIIKLSELKKL